LLTCAVFFVNKTVFSQKEISFSFLAGDSKNQRWEKVADGVEYRYVKTVDRDDENQGLKMVRLDQSRVKAKILYAEDYGAAMLTVKEMVEKSGAIAGINANYFDEKDRPLGYLKVKGREINDYIATPIIYSGIFAIQKGKGSILHRDVFHPLSCEEALQVGPRLIAEGSYTQGLNDTIDYRQRARRAGIAVDKKGRIVLFITSPPSAAMNWKELRALLMSSEKKGGIAPRDVMNLDGGGSTQLCVQAGKFSVQEGYARVPVAIGFFER